MRSDRDPLTARIFGRFSFGESCKKIEVQLDGSIHNRAHLVKILEAPQDSTDSELIKLAYLKWGTECPKHFRGEFAFVILDYEQNQLLCARDFLGVKPLHFTEVNKALAFSSFAAPLTRLPEVSRQPDELAILLYLIEDFSDQERSFYSGIRKLPPGHTLTYNKQGLKLSKYYELEASKEIRYSDSQEYAEHFLELIKSAIEARLPSAQPAGLLLSGGVDSSSLLATTKKLREEKPQLSPLEIFALKFREPEAHDQGLLDRVTSQIPWTSHLEFAEDLLEDIRLKSETDFEDVVYHPAMAMFYPLLQRAKERGISRMFMGVGADELLTLTPFYYADLIRSGRFFTLARELRANFSSSIQTMSDLLQYALKPLVPPSVLDLARNTVAPKKPPTWVPDSIAQKHNLMSRTRPHFHWALKHFRENKVSSRYNRLFVGGGYSFGFEQQELVASQFGMEFSYPLLDQRIVEFAFRLPLDLLIANGSNKHLLRESQRGLLNDEVRLKPKFQDYLKFATWVVRSQPQLNDVTSDTSQLVARGIMTPQGLTHALDMDNRNWDLDRFTQIIHMEKWLRSF